MPWKALEGDSRFLARPRMGPHRHFYSMDSVAGTLDAHLKQYLARAMAGWVAVVLEKARVVDVDRSPPANVRLAAKW